MQSVELWLAILVVRWLSLGRCPRTLDLKRRFVSLDGGRRLRVHLNARKHELFRVIHDISGTKPIILHEQPSGGRGILERLEAYGLRGFAVALLTADDVGRAKDADEEAPRARQNVVLEAGYSAGRLGRARVVLYESGVELPSDPDGIVYVPLDPAGDWKMKVAHEMASEGLHVDWSGLAGQ